MGIFDIFKNPATGKVSHSKLWANVACAAGTYKFLILPDPSVEVWAVYLGIVGAGQCETARSGNGGGAWAAVI